MADTSTEPKKVVLEAVPLEGCDPVVGTALWVMQDTRRRTLGELEGVPDEWLDIEPPMGHNTINSILYHVAAAEAGWLYEMLQQDFPADMKELCPSDDRDDTGNLIRSRGATLKSNLDRMRRVRERFIEIYKSMSAEEYRRLRTIPHWSGEQHWITPERVLHHLANHDAEHRGELVMIIQHFREQFAANEQA